MGRANKTTVANQQHRTPTSIDDVKICRSGRCICDGVSHYAEDEQITAGCCGNYLDTGECCGNAVPELNVDYSFVEFCPSKTGNESILDQLNLVKPESPVKQEAISDDLPF